MVMATNWSLVDGIVSLGSFFIPAPLTRLNKVLNFDKLIDDLFEETSEPRDTQSKHHSATDFADPIRPDTQTITARKSINFYCSY